MAILGAQHTKTEEYKRLPAVLPNIGHLLLTQATPDENMKTIFSLFLLLGIGKADERLAIVFQWSASYKYKVT